MEAVNLKEKLMSARETCRGYSEYAYRFVDYVAENLTGPIGPVGLGVAVTQRLAEIRNGYDKDGNKLREYFIIHKDAILEEAWPILQIIDVVTDDEFATEFRRFCEDAFNVGALKRHTVTDGCDYPEYIKAVLDWWSGVIQAGRDDDETNTSMRSGGYKQLTAEELLTFRRILAEGLMHHNFMDFDKSLLDTPLTAALKAVGLSTAAGNVAIPHDSFFDEDGCAWMSYGENYVLICPDCTHNPVVIWWKES